MSQDNNDPSAYPHQQNENVTAEDLAAHMQAHPEMYDPALQPHIDNLLQRNRLTVSEEDGNTITENQQFASELGGVVVGGPSAKFGITASDVVDPKLLDTKITPDVSSFIKDIDSGTPIEFLPERLIAAKKGSGYVRDGNGTYIKLSGTRSELIEARAVTTEQAELITEVKNERDAAARTTKNAKQALKNNADTISFLDDIISDTPIEYLPERLVAAKRGSGYVRDGSGSYIKLSGSRSELVENRAVTTEQAELITTVSIEQKVAKNVATKAQASLKSVADTASFLDDIISDTPIEYLPERLVAAKRGSGYVRDGSGNFLKLPRSTNNLFESRSVTSGQAELIEGIKTGIAVLRSGLPKEVQTGLGKRLSLETIDAQVMAVESSRSSSQVPADVERFDQVLTSLQDLRLVIARVELIKSFSVALTAGEEQATAVIDTAQIKTIEDRDFVADQLRPGLTALKLKNAATLALDGARSPSEVVDALAALRQGKGGEAAAIDAEAVSTFALRRLLLADYRQVFADASLGNLNYTERLSALEQLPNRASTATFDYFAEKRKLQDECTDTLVLARSAEIRTLFADKTKGVNEIVEFITGLPNSEPEDIEMQEELFKSLSLYIAARREDRRDDFSALFDDVTLQVGERLDPKIPSVGELGRNLEAAKYLGRHFKEVIAPIFQSARGDQRSKAVEQYIKTREGLGIGRESYVIDMERLKKQREMTDTEQAYIETVEALSIFNPHLVAIACELPAIARVTIENHFDQLSARTTEGLEDGQYFPSLQIGLGPNGLTAVGETARINPDLAAATLYIDAGSLPGGPFAVPRGAAWNLNSANERGSVEPLLPESPESISKKTGVKEQETIRGYGSPLPWLPGERLPDEDVRGGSINTTVDYSITPDDLTSKRYPTNDDLALVIQLQAAMLLDKVALNTEVLSISPNPNSDEQGTKLVTLRISQPGAEPREVTVKTDEVIISTGLGKPNYGFPLEGKQALKVLEATGQQQINQFPLLSDTLTSFEALANPEGPVRVLGDTLVVYGSGNSADTIIEYVAGLFNNAENPTVRNVKKIILISEQELSTRPRYLLIRDVEQRNGRPNLLEVIEDRVTDVVLGEDGKTVQLIGKNGQIIHAKNGEALSASAAVAATGFVPILDEVLADYLSEGQSIRKGDGLEQIVLPTNTKVPVGDRLTADPSVIFVGTASRPDFEKNTYKQDQLPPDPREALIRNGAPNAVAIGFRRADTQAARRITLAQNDTLRNFSHKRENPAPRIIEVDGDVATSPNQTFASRMPLPVLLPPVRRDVPSDSQILTPLLVQGLQGVRTDREVNGDFEFSVDLQPGQLEDQQEVVCDYMWRYPDGPKSRTDTPISKSLLDEVSTAINNPYFIAYWQNATPTRREKDGLKVIISFRNGRLNMKRTYAEPN